MNEMHICRSHHHVSKVRLLGVWGLLLFVASACTPGAAAAPESPIDPPAAARPSEAVQPQPEPDSSDITEPVCSFDDEEQACTSEGQICQPPDAGCGPCDGCEYLMCDQGIWVRVTEDPDIEGNDCN